MRILGVNDQHNASACLVEDGRVVAAVQEERFTRIKNHYCFPQQSVAWLLQATETDPEQLDGVAVASEHIPGAFTGTDLIRSYVEGDRVNARVRRAARRSPLYRVRRRQRRAERRAEARAAGLPLERLAFVEHQTSHAAAAYHGSPWDDEPVLVLTCDGQGDGLSASVRIGQAGQLSDPLATVKGGSSLGSVYATVTALSGMVPLEHEYKLMGLAPYAPDSGAQRSFAQFDGVLRFADDGLSWERRDDVPHLDHAYGYFRQRLELHRFDWIAAGLQRFTEQHLVTWVENAIAATGIPRVAVAGGVFMNVKANQRIGQIDGLDDLFVFPSCGDESNAMGAAFERHTSLDGGGRVQPVDDVYWGPTISDAEVGALVGDLRRDGFEVQRPDDIEAAVAELLVAGQVVARAKGPMEFGARALGNRSLLADPSSVEVVKVINDMIKSRDFWMPFAPIVRAEDAQEYLHNPKGLRSPHMMMTFDTRRSDQFPAAIQPYDRTARPQVLHQRQNPDLHRLVTLFRERTGRGVLLNTSFNLHGAPIVASARDAVDVLQRTGLRHLAVGNVLVSKPA
ncbi:carbamoyltransferase C-terminal domain-containing protein [Egicoccus halophilus]|uniref:Carbamoyltransferase n=1 Tax=Egicoccus halophilus TaxID=1670830 RepID=A0A8J3EXB7_9ACTN|nr:carbamoyltransferase C-terminal domain-containing protein [Egicoccus halophilus]GGI05442.1 carbamoyltransferase [Egicoccus halophilus]